MRKCEICGKGTGFGQNVSHANNKTKKTVYANIQSVRAQTDKGTKRMNVCTRCLRSGKITKAA